MGRWCAVSERLDVAASRQAFADGSMKGDQAAQPASRFVPLVHRLPPPAGWQRTDEGERLARLARWQEVR